MRAQFRTLLPAVLCLVPLGAQGSEFEDLLSVAKATWPEKQHIAVVCNYEKSKDQIADLASSAASGSRITVVDARYKASLPSALSILEARRADFLVMLPRDPVFSEGGFESTLLVHGMARKGIPSVGTTPNAMKQGAVFSIGGKTGHQLLVTNRLRGTVSVILPSRAAYTGKVESTVAYRTSNNVTVEIATLP